MGAQHSWRQNDWQDYRDQGYSVKSLEISTEYISHKKFLMGVTFDGDLLLWCAQHHSSCIRDWTAFPRGFPLRIQHNHVYNISAMWIVVLVWTREAISLATTNLHMSEESQMPEPYLLKSQSTSGTIDDLPFHPPRTLHEKIEEIYRQDCSDSRVAHNNQSGEACWIEFGSIK